MTQLPWVTGNWETRWLVSVIATQTLLLSAGQNDVTRAIAVLLHFVSSLQQHPSAVLPLTALTTSSTSPTICKALNCKRSSHCSSCFEVSKHLQGRHAWRAANLWSIMVFEFVEALLWIPRNTRACSTISWQICDVTCQMYPSVSECKRCFIVKNFLCLRVLGIATSSIAYQSAFHALVVRLKKRVSKCRSACNSLPFDSFHCSPTAGEATSYNNVRISIEPVNAWKTRILALQTFSIFAHGHSVRADGIEHHVPEAWSVECVGELQSGRCHHRIERFGADMGRKSICLRKTS